jgi:hypothetical protein
MQQPPLLPVDGNASLVLKEFGKSLEDSDQAGTY